MNPITTKVTETVDLGSTDYPSPLVIGPGGEVYPSAAGANGVYSDASGVMLTLDATVFGRPPTAGGEVFGGAGSGGTNGGIGVDLLAQATVINNNDITGGTGNTGDNAGVALSMLGGGTLKNYYDINGGGVHGGTGNGGTAVVMAGGTITNDGTILGGSTTASLAATAGDGVDLSAGGVLTNSGGIIGGLGGISGTGVSLTSGAELDNDAGAVTGGNSNVATANGVGVIASDATVMNSALISGGNGDNGGLDGTGGIGLEVLSGSTVTNKSTGNIYGGSGGKGANGGLGVDLSSGSLTNSGTIEGGLGYGATAGGVGVELNGGTLTDSNKIQGGASGTAGTGGVGVEFNGGKLTVDGKLDGGIANGVTADSVKFGSAPVTMYLQSGAQISGDIGGFTVVGDTIDITNWDTSGTDPAASFNSTHTALPTPDGELIFAYSLAGDYKFTPDSGGTGTDLTITSPVAACYRRGTRIRTPAGEVAIETLCIGDVVTTLWGDTRAIRWIGRRSYSAAYAANNDAVAPIRIRAGALAENVPQRDLWVSPEHAMWIDGVLIPARALVNKSSIIRETAVADLTYIHLEFDAHEVIYAEGAPSESFVDDESREQFDNAREYRRLYPDAIRQPARFCAPRVEDGAELEAVLGRLRVRNTEAMIGRAPPPSPALLAVSAVT